MRPRLPTGATAALAAASLGACSGPENVLDPAGPGAARIAGLWWYLFVLGTVVFLVVLALFTVPLVRRGRGGDADGRPPPADEGRARRWIGGGAVASFLVLVAVQVVALPLGRDVAPAPAGAGEFAIEVDARQFWWHVRYPDADVVTANEIHIPTDTPVRFRVTSSDVVHTFWIPRLHGKVEVTPGRVLDLVLEADEPGLYPGRCTEFCGLAHAQMKVRVVAQAPDDFATWLDGQAAPAEEPATEAARAGLEVFRGSSCVHCHTVRGHAGTSDIGPDLTHLASRDTIAAGALPNRRGHLGGWILDPQGNKPGARMPPTQLDGEQVQVLLDYLGSLR